MTRTPTSPSVSIIQLPRHLAEACRDCVWKAQHNATLGCKFQERAGRAARLLDELLECDENVIEVPSANRLQSILSSCPDYGPQVRAACDEIARQLAGTPQAKPPDPARELSIATEAKRLREDGVVVQRGLFASKESA